MSELVGGAPASSSPARRDAAAINSPIASRASVRRSGRGRLTNTSHCRRRRSPPCVRTRRRRTVAPQGNPAAHPLPAGLGPGRVRDILAAHHRRCARRPRRPAGRIHQQDHVAAAQPAHLAPPSPPPAIGDTIARPARTGRPAAARRSARRWPDPGRSGSPADAGPTSATPSDRRPRAFTGRSRSSAASYSIDTAAGPDRSRQRAPPCPAPRSAHR